MQRAILILKVPILNVILPSFFFHQQLCYMNCFIIEIRNCAYCIVLLRITSFRIIHDLRIYLWCHLFLYRPVLLPESCCLASRLWTLRQRSAYCANRLLLLCSSPAATFKPVCVSISCCEAVVVNADTPYNIWCHVAVVIECRCLICYLYSHAILS